MNEQRLVNLFIEVARINALSGSEKPIADFIKTFLSKLGYQVEEDDSGHLTNSDTGNLICKIGTGGDFVLLSHMDTARPTKDVKPIIEKDKITSSGDTVLGVDNRAGVAALLFTLEKIALEKIPVKDFTVAFTTCEETTLFGSKNLGVNGKIKHGFIFDSGYRPGNFIYAACGSIGLTIKVIGKASHSGISPEKGINSMQVAAKAISQLPLGRIDEETTMNIGLLKSGSAVNVIPELTELEGEVRSFNLKKAEDNFNLLVNIFKSEAEKVGAKVEVNHFWDFLPYTIPENAFVYKEIIRVLNKVGLKSNPTISLGGSDANSLNGRGIESVNIGIGAQNPHSNEEFIYIEDLIKTAEIALELVKKE
ncbi:MAG: M20/M25/M40 family metallo-hydrolase [Ignavibacterium sp.]|jgi:tripeptide aminopeptidase|nr:M20/M25/M40 family metallo-hydrolase [Ignavibacterium sp.]